MTETPLIYYAMKKKNEFHFINQAVSLPLFEEKTYRSFWAWKGMQAREKKVTIDDYMQGYEKVKITIERINI
jgi:hypothetical protein